MVAIMKYEAGLKFTGYVCEDKATAEKFVREELGWVNPRCYELVPVTYVHSVLKIEKD